jgi:hypothetical protein
MIRSLFTALPVVLLCASMSAQAAQIVTTVPANDPIAAHEKLVEAATKVCKEAIAHDYFGDFGSLDECVEDSVAMVKPAIPVRVANK